MPAATLSALLLQYKYVVMVPLLVVAQPIVGMTAGFLSRFGEMNLVVAFFVMVCTALVSDIVWYCLGVRFGDRFMSRFGPYVSITKDNTEEAKRLFFRYHSSILLISKIVNGLGFAIVVMFTAGLTRVPLVRFIVLNMVGECVWSAALLAIGYQFSSWFLWVDTALGRVFLIVGLVLIGIFVARFAQYLASRLREA